MTGLEPACATNTNALSSVLPNSQLFPQLITEYSVIHHLSNRNVCDRSQTSPCLIANNFVVNYGDIFFVIYHKNVSDK